MRMTRTDWAGIKWGDPRKQCGAQCWNESHRIEQAFKRYPSVVEYLGTPCVSTGLWADVKVRHADGTIDLRRVS